MSQIRLPARIYTTPAGARSSDDLQYGNMTEQQLRSVYHLDDVSARVNPYTLTKIEEIKASPFSDYNFPDRPSSLFIDYFPKKTSRLLQPYPETKSTLSVKQCSDILFDEMRELSKPFALYGVYSGLIVKMINHMQKNSGLPFRDYLLNMALERQIRYDISGNSSLKNIQIALRKGIDWKKEEYPEVLRSELNKSMQRSVLPKFKRFKDKFNGMGITVHDTYATQITLTSLFIANKEYKASINYKVQDHFGLDKKDISNPQFKMLRFFRIWFVLQRWEKLGFKPFTTEMEANVSIRGSIR